MPITSIAEMMKIDTSQWNYQQQGWIPLWTEIQNNGNIFFNHITFNVPIRAEEHAYWDFQINNARKPATMGLKVRALGNVSIYFTDGDDALRQEQIEEFRKKLVDAGFSPDREKKEWTRDAMTLKIDGYKDISFAIIYPGGMDDTARAQWQVQQLITLSQLVSELYH